MEDEHGRGSNLLSIDPGTRDATSRAEALVGRGHSLHTRAGASKESAAACIPHGVGAAGATERDSSRRRNCCGTLARSVAWSAGGGEGSLLHERSIDDLREPPAARLETGLQCDGGRAF